MNLSRPNLVWSLLCSLSFSLSLLLLLLSPAARAGDFTNLPEMRLRLSFALANLHRGLIASPPSQAQIEQGRKLFREMEEAGCFLNQPRVTNLRYRPREIWCGPAVDQLSCLGQDGKSRIFRTDNFLPVPSNLIPALPVDSPWLFTPDHRLLAWPKDKETYQVYDLARKTEILIVATKPPCYTCCPLVFTPNGALLVTGDVGGQGRQSYFQVWDTKTGKSLQETKFANGPTTVAGWQTVGRVGIPGGKQVVLSYQQNVFILEEVVKKTVPMGSDVEVLALTGDNNIAVGLANGEIVVLKAGTLEILGSFPIVTRNFRHLLFTPKKQDFLAVTARDVWWVRKPPETPVCVTRVPEDILGAVLSPDGGTLYFSTSDTIWSCLVQLVRSVGLPENLTLDHLLKGRKSFLEAMRADSLSAFMIKVQQAIQAMQ